MGKSAAAKMLCAGLLLLVLAIGLCSTGGGFDTHVTQAQIAMTYVGAASSIVGMGATLRGLVDYLRAVWQGNKEGR